MQYTFKVGIVTISDTRSANAQHSDQSGDSIESMIAGEGYSVIFRKTISDDVDLISKTLMEGADEGEVDLIITTGGTGLAPRDVTPEATQKVLDIEIPGLGEAMRMGTFEKTNMSILSRATGGIRSGCLIINLPGSPKGVQECLSVVVGSIHHALEMIRGWKTHGEDANHGRI